MMLPQPHVNACNVKGVATSWKNPQNLFLLVVSKTNCAHIVLTRGKYMLVEFDDWEAGYN